MPVSYSLNLKIVLGDYGQRIIFGLEIEIYNDKRDYQCSNMLWLEWI